jgi:hypothetical protein
MRSARTKALLLSALYLLAAALCLSAAVAVFGYPPAESDESGWTDAANRIATRIGLGEVVLIHPTDNVSKAGPLAGLPVVCDPGDKRHPKLESLEGRGLWGVGGKKLPARARKLLKELPHRGSIDFGTVHVAHGWHWLGKKKGQ